MMAASISAAGASFESGPPRPLFASRIVGGGAAAREYAVARDGRFLINQAVADATAAPIMLLLNWNPDGKQSRR